MRVENRHKYFNKMTVRSGGVRVRGWGGGGELAVVGGRNIAGG